jgi:hypothetical protein
MPIERWRRDMYTSNQGTSEFRWTKGPFIIVKNYPVYNKGNLLRWEFEVLGRSSPHSENLIGRARSLASAKKLAKKHDI